MNKTLILAATLLSLGAGGAFADGTGYAKPAQISGPATASQTVAQSRIFPAGTHQQTNVYSMFPAPGTTQEASR